MATRPAVYQATLLQGVAVFKWTALAQDDDGSAIYVPNHSDKTAQFYGTFGGATVKLQGSNDPLADPQLGTPSSAVWWDVLNVSGDVMAKTSAGGWLIVDNPIYMRALISGGDASTNVNVIVCAKKG